jgi:thiol:disulfide interchange protein DsbD
MPRSGAWMAMIKKGMGLLMLGLAQYFFIKAGSLFF